MKYIVIWYNFWGEIAGTELADTLEEVRRISSSLRAEEIEIYEGKRVSLG